MKVCVERAKGARASERERGPENARVLCVCVCGCPRTVDAPRPHTHPLSLPFPAPLTARLDELRALNRKTFEETGAYMTEEEIKAFRQPRWTDRREFVDDD